MGVIYGDSHFSNGSLGHQRDDLYDDWSREHILTPRPHIRVEHHCVFAGVGVLPHERALNLGTSLCLCSIPPPDTIVCSKIVPTPLD
jgi:hypothetical protein